MASIAQPPPQPEQYDIGILKIAVAILGVFVVILIFAAGLTLAKLYSGKPPQAYRTMMEQAPALMRCR